MSSIITGGIASIEAVRNQLENASVRVLRLETRCHTISITVKNLERLLEQINNTIREVEEESHNVNKWNTFYDGHLQNGQRGLMMLKESRDKKWKQYELESRNIRMIISERQREVEDRKETHARNIQLIWNKIPMFKIMVEKQQAISSLEEKLKSIRIEHKDSGNSLTTAQPPITNNKLTQKNEKLELQCDLKRRKEELDHWKQQLVAIKTNRNYKSQERVALETELKELKQIEMEIQNKKELQSQCVIEKQNGRNSEGKAILHHSNSDDSGIATLNENPGTHEVMDDTSINEQSMDQTMFEEQTHSPKKNEGPKTPSKNECTTTLGPVHSTPHRSASKLSEFLRPKSASHCSAPPNLTPITNNSLVSNTRIFTPQTQFQKLQTKVSIGMLPSLQETTPAKTTIPSGMKIGPVNPDIRKVLPTTPVSTLSKSKLLPLATTPAKKISCDFPMNKGLLAPTPEKEITLEGTPTKQLLPSPSTPAAPIKNSPAVNNRLLIESTRSTQQEKKFGEHKEDSNSIQPESKKLKPSNSFINPSSPERNPSTAQLSATRSCTDKLLSSSTASGLEPANTTKPKEFGDCQEATLSRVETELDGSKVIPAGKNDVMPFEDMFRGSPVPMAINSNQKDKCGRSESPFDFNFTGGSTFGDTPAFAKGSGFGGDFSSGFGSASGDSASFGSGFGGFNF